MTREVILDSETTGISVEQGHRIISLGVVEIVNGIITGRECEWFINPDAYRVHRIADRWLAKQPTFRSFAPAIADFIGEDKIIAHNAKFDRGHLNKEFERLLGYSSPSESEKNRFPIEQWQDSLTIARKMFRGQPCGLDALADRYGVYRGHRIAHGALKDARILAQVWVEMRRGTRDDLLAGLEVQTPVALREVKPYDYSARRQRKPKSRLTSAEKKQWQEVWVKGLGKDAVWNDYLQHKDQ